MVLENVELGNDIVLTAPFTDELENASWLHVGMMAKIMQQHVQLKVISVHVDKPTMLSRLISRNELRDTWKLNNWDEYIKIISEVKIAWDWDLYKEYTFDNSDCLPIFYDLKVNNLINWLNG
ncbi:hypothetical protein [Bacillus massiliigorillae]|uniref:hypothetical protein n=1 Tax=Bacillus massiliigorillae TaxID=1243664 RepID=UPI0003A4FD41|nr:hypothetical protein [Bacillus massiliigorillae]